MAETEVTEASASEASWTAERVVKWAAVGLIGLVVVLFFFAFVVALGNAEGAASFMGYFRNLLLIVLTLQGILIFAGLAVLFIQMARFFNLLSHEMKPLSEEARSALATVKQTTQFVAKHGSEPLIQVQAFLAGLSAFVRELLRWRHLFRRKDAV